MSCIRKRIRALASCAALSAFGALFAPTAGARDDAKWAASGTATLTSDYVFRGISQCDERPALQAGLELQHVDFGAYAMAWGSNVDYGDVIGTNAEIDLVLGWRGGIRDDLAFDINLTRYTYPGTNEALDLDYDELIATLSFEQSYWLTIGWSNDVFASDGTGTYVQAGGKWPFNGAWRIEALAAHYFLNRESQYSHAQLSLVRGWKRLELRLSGHLTDDNAKESFGDRLAGDRVEAAVSFAF